MELGNVIAVDRLAALAQPHRLAVYRLLVVAGATGLLPGEIAAELGIPASSLSFHLSHLRRAGLVSAVRQGRFMRYGIDVTAMRDLVDFLTQQCSAGAAPVPSKRPGDAMRDLLARQRA